MEQNVRRLVCHGFEIFANNRLSKLCESVCRIISKLAGNYDEIFLLAGMHLKEPNITTVDLAMRDALIAYGVPADKIKVWSDWCPKQRPPRTTMEEVDIVPHFFRALKLNPKEMPFDVVSIWYFRWRILFLFRHRGAKVGQFHGAPSRDIVRMGIELLAYIATRIWPTGQGWGAKYAFEKQKAERIVFETQPNGKPWEENVYTAWDDPLPLPSV